MSDKVDELKSFKNLQGYKLEANETIRNLSTRWVVFLDNEYQLDALEIQKIYRVNQTVLVERNLKTMRYYIENNFWNLLNDHKINFDSFSDEQLFDTPSLNTYFLILDNGIKLMLLLSMKEGLYSQLFSYRISDLNLSLFTNRQLVYSKEKGFITI